jgi:RNA polymerase-binding transcription factor DksA
MASTRAKKAEPVKKAATAKKVAAKKATQAATPKKAAPIKKSAGAAAAPKKAASKTPAKPPPSTKRPAATPPAKKAVSAKKTSVKTSASFDAAFLESQRAALLEERANLIGQAQRLEDEAAELMEDLDPGDVQFDDESGEGDSIVVERERDLALSAQARQTIIDIDAALERIKDGTYGFSVVSGRSIPKERLRAIPWATELVEEKVGGLGSRR